MHGLRRALLSSHVESADGERRKESGSGREKEVWGVWATE